MLAGFWLQRQGGWIVPVRLDSWTFGHNIRSNWRGSNRKRINHVMRALIDKIKFSECTVAPGRGGVTLKSAFLACPFEQNNKGNLPDS